MPLRAVRRRNGAAFLGAARQVAAARGLEPRLRWTRGGQGRPLDVLIQTGIHLV